VRTGHPGAQLDAFEEADGWRYTAFATDTRSGQLAHLDARHRAHARVEDRIRIAKDTGLDHFPSRSFAINEAWLTFGMLAVDLIAWTQHLLLHGDLAKAEPKSLRYRLLHVAARLTRGQRRSGCASNAPGPGPATSPQRSPASPHCPSRPADHRPPTRRTAGPTGRTARRQRRRVHHRKRHRRDRQSLTTRSIHSLTNDRG
jgi:Transposase DDE domain group 1